LGEGKEGCSLASDEFASKKTLPFWAKERGFKREFS